MDDPKQRRPDITRARTILGWEPKIDLEEGLLKTVDYFKTKVDSVRVDPDWRPVPAARSARPGRQRYCGAAGADGSLISRRSRKK